MSNVLKDAVKLIYTELSAFSNLDNFWNLFDSVFGTQYNSTVAATIRSQWQVGDFSKLPQIEVILSDSLDNGDGTYDSSTNKIYLSASFIATATQEAVSAFLLQEIGHFVGNLVNQTITPGNEGAIFADFILGNSLTELKLKSVQASSNLHNAGCTCLSCALPPVNPDRLKNPEAVSATLDLSQTFSLNSLAGANHTIYLDFNGHTTSGTIWNTSYGLANIVTPAYDFDGNTASFSSAELERIQYIWQRVAEDFRPFNVNVTTQEPADINDLIKSGSGDTRWGVRVAIGGSSDDWYGAGAGGVAYVGSFNWNSDTPTYVFEDQLGNGSEKSTAEAISHEVGHTLGLRHDGRSTPNEGYYTGHGSGNTGWAPIMGVGYYQNLSQWSKGQYASANNTEDDLQIITTQNGFGYRADDAGNTIATAKALTFSGTSWSGNGIIERNTDIDFYSFATDAGTISLTVNPLSRGPNLDISAQLYNSSGTLIASSNPTDLLSATITTNVLAGTYYLAIDGAGKGDPLSTGYTDYGSLGQYFISGNIDRFTYSNFSNSGAISIPSSGASNPYPSSINVSGVNGNLANLKVTLTDLSHNWADDIDVLLVGPTGAKVILMSDVGGSSVLNNVTFTFDASATAALSDSEQLTSGTYLPTDFESGDIFDSPAPAGTYGTDLSVFNNTNPNGIWNLYVIDDMSGDIGTIAGGWSLSIGTDSTLPIITLAVAPSSVSEDGTTNLVYTFTRSGSTTDALTVNYNVGGNATFNTDYTQSGAASFTATTGTITFAAGSSTKTLTIDPKADTTVESNETVALTLATGTGYSIGTTTPVTGTIVNDDTSVTLAVAPSSVAEDGTSNLVYTFTRTGATTNALTVNYNVGGNATFNTDYTQSGAASFTATTGTITFAAGSSTKTLTIDPKADTTVESNETVALTLATGTGYSIGTTTPVTGTIVNDDTSVTLAVAPSSVAEDGTSNLVYTFTRTGATANALTVNYNVGGNATFNTDYTQSGAASFTATTGTITFAAGASTATLTIDPTADTTVENNETVVLTLASGTGYTIATTTGVTGTIINDDFPVITVAATDANAAETNTGITANPGIFTLTRIGSTTNALTVNYTLSGTATKGTDYSNLTGTVSFAASSSTATVTVTPINDNIFEGTETVTLTLGSGTGYTLDTTSIATVNIADNDSQPTINLSSNQTLVEGNTSPQNATYTVKLSNPSSQTITVNYATANGTATAGSDYTNTTGTLTFNPGVTSQVINIPILNDSINETNETFTLALTSPTNASLTTTTIVTTTLTDTLTASVTTTLPANVENLTLSGTAAINGTGNAGDNILKGNSANNTLFGGNGNDTYAFVATTALGTDTIVETTIGGTDTLDFTGTSAAVNVNLGVTTSQRVNSNLKLILSANNTIENVTGGTGNDRITGNALNNTLIGGNGNDQLQGLAGDDLLWGGLGNDILTGGTGQDKYLFQSNAVFSTTLGVDYIAEFEVESDSIVLSKTTFNALTSDVGEAFTDFEVVSDDDNVNASNALIVFSQSTGSLFYNQDGNALGTGTVFEFARLGNPDITLSANNFTLIA